MPKKPLRPCSHPGCPNLCEGQFCEQHRVVERRKYDKYERSADVNHKYVLGGTGVLRTAVIFFYLSNEGVSLLENAAHLGLPIPEKLKEVLEQLHDRATDEKGGEE